MTINAQPNRGFWSSLSYAAERTFTTVGNTANAVDETLSIATVKIHHRAKATKIADKEEVLASLTDRLQPIRQKLKTDEDFAALYSELESEF